MLDLVKNAQNGNDKAFLALFQKYEQDIYRMAFVYVKNQTDALEWFKKQHIVHLNQSKI